MKDNWQLDIPLDAIVFDCDGTLSNIEGIDELARASGHYREVSAITTLCMSTTGLNEESYEHRLQLIKPSKDQIQHLVDQYIDHMTPGTKQVISTFQVLGKRIYIISSGIAEAVIPFGNYFGVKTEDIYAVNVNFNAQGEYIGFDRKNPLVHSGGKLAIIKKILLTNTNIAFIGDGMSDYEASSPVTRFIGYGGMCLRDKIRTLSKYYLICRDLHPLLPLCLTKREADDLDENTKVYYQDGMKFIENGSVIIRKD